MSTKQQKTLFQSWGGNASTCRGKEEELLRERGRGRGRGRGGLQEVAPVIDLCEEEEDILLAHALDISCAEEPASSFGGPDRKKPSILFSKYGVNNQNEPNIDNGNVSVGADQIHESMLPTSYAHEAVSGTHSSDLPGFDKQAGRLWIYPTNYPVRDYQFNIVQQCLYKNTMVTLPTGLGKTFIAAVVMYNFYQWYPQGKIVFMAPTKPLVAQQIDACYNIMGIPHTDTAEMTGTMNPTERQCVWKERRVFFLTPQVMTNDLSRGTCPAADVRCLVIDEAHRALGNHAYCQVVRELVKYTKNFRVLALSATPGADIKAVQQVISNLLISQIELRTEDCLDIKPYTHERRVDKIVVPLGEELSSLRDQYTQVMGMVVQRLIRQRAIYNRDPASLSKFLILKAREAFRQDPPQQLPRQQYGVVEGDFALALSLYHGYELLQLHGLRSLYNFLQTVLSGEKGHGRTRTELLKSAVFLQIMDTLRQKFQQDESELSCTQKQQSYVSAHPKMKKLEEVVLEHFDKVHMAGDEAGGETRVMIFSQYRDSVQEITTLLNMHRPRVKAMSFIGQSSAGKSTKGFTQKEQLKVMKEFREGGYNTLISTCVGEEGLDIGDIDLIICFDANKSPIRLVQRMGRTGRKRQGRIVMLVTQGKEEQIYNQSQYSKRSIHKAIMNGARSLHFYRDNPQMLPEGLAPVCHKMFITVNHTQSKNTTANRNVKTQKKISSFERAGNQGIRRDVDEDEPLTREEWGELQRHLVPTYELRSLPQGPPSLLSLHPSQGGHSSLKNRSLSLNEWMPWQNRLQTWRLVDHSIRSKHLVELIEFIQLQELLEEEDNQYSLEMENFLQLDDVLEGGQQLDDVLEGGQQLDDVLEGGQQLDDVLEGGQQLDDVLELVEGRGPARGGGARRKGRWDMLPALCGREDGKEEEEEDLPVFDVGRSSPSRHSGQGQEQLNSQSCTQSHLTKEEEGKNCKVKHKSTFLESFAVDDSGDFEEDKTLIKHQVADMCLVERKCSRTTFPKDVAIFFDLPHVKNKNGVAQYNGSKVFSIPSPPPLEEIKDVFPKLVDEFAAVNVVRLVSEWYKETLGESVQVRWAKSEVVESLVPASEPHTTDQMDMESDVDSTDSKPEAQTFTSIQAKVIQNEVNQNGRKISQIDTFDKMKSMPLSNEGDDENLKTLLAGVVTRDPERTEASRDKSRNEPVAENKQDGDATLNLTDNQSRKSLLHNSRHKKNSPTCEVTAVKDCLTFTQAMACVQSSDEHSQALSQLSSSSPDPLATQRKRDLSPAHVSTDKPFLDQLSIGNSDLYPSNFAIDRSRLVSSDHFQTEKINYHINNHLVIDKNKDLPSKYLTGDSSRECSPNSDILFCDMPSFNLFEDVSDVDMSKEGADGPTLPIELPCQAASLFDNSHRGFHEEHSDYKTAECKGSQVDLLEDEFDMPQFELNFDLDEDIIPPSPQVSQPFSQKSFNRSQSAPPTKRKLDLGKTKLDSAITENVEAEAEDRLCEFSNAASCAASATEHLTRREDAAPKTPSLLSPLPGQVRSSTPKQDGSRFTKVKKVCHHPPSPPGSLLEEGEDEEQVEGTRKSWLSNPNLTRLSRTENTISPSSYHTHQGLKETTVDLDLDDDSFLDEKKPRLARTLEDSEDFQLGGPSFKTPSRPTVRCKKRFQVQMKPGGSKSSSTSSAPSSEDMSSSSRLHQDQAAPHTVSERSAFTTRKPKHSTKTDVVKRRPKRPGCEFLDQEAVLSGDSAASSDEFLNSQDDDQYELSFVNDHTQMSQLDVDMQAVYLQSVRSPEEVPKRFRLQPRHYRRHVFSPGETGVIRENVDVGSGDEYEEDSFCVAEGEEDTEYVEDEEDTLDELENILRNGKRKAKVPRIKTLTFDNRKTRKRIRHFSGSSSEDEFKAQVQVSTSEDTHNRTADREDVQELLCSQRAEPAPRRRKLIVCSSDEETSPRAQLQYQSPGVATHHSHTLSLADASLGSTVAMVTCSPGGATHCLDRGTRHTLGQDMTEMNESKTTDEPVLVEQTSGKREVDRYHPHSTERAPVLNRFNQELQDFDFVSDQLKTSIAKPLAVTSEYRQKERVVVLVDSRELSGAQDIISSLRLKHGFTVAARQLEACDYILSCRLAVDRKNLSEFSSGGNRAKLTERLQRMRELYDRCCIIVERDRLKSGDTSDRSSHRSKYCDWIQALLVQTNIRLFYTDNQDETSVLLAQLAEMEKKKGLNICVPLHLSTDRDQCIKFYNSIPMLNYANALQLAQSFSSIKDFISRCSPGWLSGAGQMSEVRAAHIITYIKHTFDLQMLPTRR